MYRPVPEPPSYLPPVYDPYAQPGVSQPAPDQGWAQGHYQQAPDGSYTDVPYEKAASRNRRGVAGAAGAAGLALLKYAAALKFIIPTLLKAPFLLSIVLNIGIYAFFFGSHYGPLYGLAFGAGFVALIFVHEMGHLIAARLEGIKATVPFFIPFMGAAIFLRENPQNARSEAIIGIGGPITGTLGAMACFGAGSLLGPTSPEGLLLIRLSYYGFFINLFNMIPFTPLDGGRILGAVSKWFNVVGLGVVVLGMVSGVLNSPVLLIILLFGAFGTYRRFTQPERPGYYQTSMAAKAVIGLSYLALLAILIGGLVSTEVFMGTA